MNKKILTLNKISKTGLSHLEKKGYECSDSVTEPDAVLVRSASMHESPIPSSVKAIARAGAGVNNIPVDLCSEKGIVVFNTPGANSNAVKELVIAGLLLSSRRIVDAIDWVKTVKDEPELSKLIEKGKSRFVGPELHGKTLGVIGLGAIGVLVANAAQRLGMNVLGYDPFLSVESAWHLSRSITHAESLKEVFSSCDYITVHVPLLDSTKGMINAESLSMMKDGVRIMNFSRGGLVNDDDMVSALESGKVASYVTDFPSAKIISAKNAIAIPHLGASTPESEENCAVCAADELLDFLENGNIRNSVNFPNVSTPRETNCRLCIIHKNVPNVIAKISSAVSSEGLNIENLLNKAKKDIAYTIVDIALGDRNVDFESVLKAIDGVIRVRVIK